MDQSRPIDMESLVEEAKESRGKEAYRLLEKTVYGRIGIGARADVLAPPSLFFEVIVSLSTGNGEVNLPYMERALSSLKALQEEGYKMTLQDDNSISCEKTIVLSEISREYAKIKSIIDSVCKDIGKV